MIPYNSRSERAKALNNCCFQKNKTAFWFDENAAFNILLFNSFCRMFDLALLNNELFVQFAFFGGYCYEIRSLSVVCKRQL